MTPWVRYRRGRARYNGRLSRAPFDAWLATPKGQQVLDNAMARTRFSFFARARTARRLWRQLASAARQPSALVVIQSEIDAYLGHLEQFAYADGLPRLSVDLHRLVAVPRVLINGAAYGAIARRLHAERVLEALEGGDPLRDFFITTLIDHLDSAIAGAAPSVKRPMAAGKDWISVGLENAFVWRLPILNERPWTGHHYVLELTRDPITRAVRKKVTAAVQAIDASLGQLSRVERNEILRRALRGA